MKKCSKCRKEKELSEFYKRGDSDKYRSHCKVCEKTKPKSEATKRWRARAKKTLIEEYGGKCMDCGFIGPSVCYDFDHRDPSEKSYALSQYKGGIDGLRIEAEKCDLVCANCHRIRTHMQRCKCDECDICNGRHDHW